MCSLRTPSVAIVNPVITVFWFIKGEFLKIVPPFGVQTGRKASLCYLINTWGGGMLNTALQKVCYKIERK